MEEHLKALEGVVERLETLTGAKVKQEVLMMDKMMQITNGGWWGCCADMDKLLAETTPRP